MTEKELRRLRRSELLAILLNKTQEIEQLNRKVDMLEKQLNSRTIMLNESGSIAEASIGITNVFQEAQKAANVYLENLKRMSDEAKEGIDDKIKAQKEEAEKYASEKRAEADRYVEEQHKLADQYWDEVRDRIQMMIEHEQGLKGMFSDLMNHFNPRRPESVPGGGT